MIQLYTVYKRLTLDPKTQMVKSKRNEKKKKKDISWKLWPKDSRGSYANIIQK